MFVRQAQHAYDSIGAPDFPDLAVALLYYPVVGWVLGRAIKLGTTPRVGTWVALWHVVAIGLAWGTVEVRNKLWGF
jgi:ABC-type uncharacterized transport system permease subunit